MDTVYKCLYTVYAVEVTLVLRDFVLRDLSLTQLEILHQFSNLRNNIRFNTIWHRRFIVTVIFCRRLQEVTSLSRHLSRVWVDFVGVIST
jgi:hypothetical protein